MMFVFVFHMDIYVMGRDYLGWTCARWINTVMHIYVIGTNGNRQKIGYSKDPSRRLKTLQTANSEKLFLYWSFEVDDSVAPKVEKYIHNQYAHLRVNGEWFDMTKEDAIAFVQYMEIMIDRILLDIQLG